MQSFNSWFKQSFYVVDLVQIKIITFKIMSLKQTQSMTQFCVFQTQLKLLFNITKIIHYKKLLNFTIIILAYKNIFTVIGCYFLNINTYRSTANTIIMKYIAVKSYINIQDAPQ